jgi:hypothetical protein
MLGCARTWRGRAPKSSGLTAYGRARAAKSLIFRQKAKAELSSVTRSIAAFGIGCRAIFQRVSLSDARSRSHRSKTRWNFSRPSPDLLLRALFHHSVSAISPLDRSQAFDSERRHGASDGSPFSAAAEHRRRRHGGFQTGHIFLQRPSTHGDAQSVRLALRDGASSRHCQSAHRAGHSRIIAAHE